MGFESRWIFCLEKGNKIRYYIREELLFVWSEGSILI